MEKIHRVRASTYRYNVKYYVEKLEGMPSSNGYEYVVVGFRHWDVYETKPVTVSGGCIDFTEQGESACFRTLCKFYFVDGWTQYKWMRFVVKQIPRSKAAITAGEGTVEVGDIWMDMGELRKNYKMKLNCPGATGEVFLHVRAEYQCMEMGDKREDAIANIDSRIGKKDEDEQAQEEEKRERERSYSLAPSERGGPQYDCSDEEYAPPDEDDLAAARKRFQDLLASYKQIAPKDRKENDVGGRLKAIEGVMRRVDFVSILKEYMSEMDIIEMMVLKAQQDEIRAKQQQQQQSNTTPRNTPRTARRSKENPNNNNNVGATKEPLREQNTNLNGQGGGKGGALVVAKKPKSLTQERQELVDELRWINFREERGHTGCDFSCLIS